VKQWRGDEQENSDEQRRASMKGERALKNREGSGWESNEELQNLREMQKLTATGNKRGKNKTYRARSSFFPVPICNRRYLALLFVVINWGTNYLKAEEESDPEPLHKAEVNKEII
jgi:hypothetical protein